MKEGGWRMKKKIFFMLKMHIYATHGEASEDGLLAVHGGQQDDIFLYDSYFLYLQGA